MLHVHVFREGQELTDVPVADLSTVRAEPEVLVWVDLASPTHAEMVKIGEEFGLHPRALAACGHRTQRPKVEEYPGHAVVIAYGARLPGDGGTVALHEVDLIVGANYLLSFHRGAAMEAKSVARRVGAHPELAHQGGGFLLYVVLDELVGSFFPVLDRIGERVEDLEEAVFSGTGPQVQAETFRLRKDMVRIRRVAGPMRDAMVVLLRRDLGLFEREAQRYLQDVYDHLIRVVESVEDYQDLASGVLEADLSVVSNRVNEVARTLTAYASIFAAITVITGLYGMNFRYMPELGWRFGYPFALGLMAAAAGGLLAYFKRKGWL